MRNFNKETIFMLPLLDFKLEQVVTGDFKNCKIDDCFLIIKYSEGSSKYRFTNDMLINYKHFEKEKYEDFTPVAKDKILKFWKLGKRSKLGTILKLIS